MGVRGRGVRQDRTDERPALDGIIERRNGLAQLHQSEFGRRGPSEGCPAAQRLPEHDAERVLIGRGRGGRVAKLLRAGVERRASGTQVEIAGVGTELGNAEVGQVAVARLVEEDVGRFHVPVDDAQGMGGRQCTAQLVDQPTDVGQAEWTLGFAVAQRATPEEPEHQKGSAGPAPEVVQRHDMGMLDAGHELGLGLEPLHEPGIVGQVGADHFDRDLTVEAGLDGSVHRTECTLADDLCQLVARQGDCGPSGQQRVALSDAVIQLDQGIRRIEPGFVGEVLTEPLERPQRVGLTPSEVQRPHQEAHEVLAKGLLGYEDLDLDDGIRMASAVDQCRGPLTEREEAQLLEPSGDRQEPPLVGILAIGAARPVAERSVVRGYRIGGSVDSGPGQRELEVGGVEARPVEPQLVAVLPGDDVVPAYGGAEPRDVAHHGPTGALGRVVVRPDRLDQPVGADDRVVVGQQRGQQPPLLRASERDRLAVRQGADGPLQHGEANLRRGRRPVRSQTPAAPTRIECRRWRPSSPFSRTSRVSPKWRSPRDSTISRTSDDTRISPPWAWLAIRAANRTGCPNRSLSSTIASPVCIPIRIRNASVGCDRPWASRLRMISIEHRRPSGRWGTPA